MRQEDKTPEQRQYELQVPSRKISFGKVLKQAKTGEEGEDKAEPEPIPDYKLDERGRIYNREMNPPELLDWRRAKFGDIGHASQSIGLELYFKWLQNTGVALAAWALLAMPLIVSCCMTDGNGEGDAESG